MKIIKSLIALTLVITLAACSTGSKVTKTDVLVIGGGGAGLVASVTAAEAGKNVILVEKMAAV